VDSEHRAYAWATFGHAGDLPAHEYGHVMDSYTDRFDRVVDEQTLEILADMFAFDFDPDDETLGVAPRKAPARRRAAPQSSRGNDPASKRAADADRSWASGATPAPCG
jgi:hypothetical protein